MPNIEWLSEHSFNAARQPTHSFEEVGKCIYCGSEAPALGNEHIWPDGLGGHLVLPKASCRPCERIIDRFEQPAITVNFGLVRTANGIHSKKRRQQSRPKSIRAVADGARDIEILPGPRAPQFVTTETPGRRPSVLSGLEHHAGKLSRHIGAHNVDMEMPNGYGIRVDGYASGVFPRFLAKVAHAYAVSTASDINFEPFLTDLILGDAPATKSRYLGDLPRFVAPNHLTTIKLGITTAPFFALPNLPPVEATLLLVRLDMFTNLNLPTYEAVVGRVWPE